jgi:hypothetical protein
MPWLKCPQGLRVLTPAAVGAFEGPPWGDFRGLHVQELYRIGGSGGADGAGKGKVAAGKAGEVKESPEGAAAAVVAKSTGRLEGATRQSIVAAVAGALGTAASGEAGRAAGSTHSIAATGGQAAEAAEAAAGVTEVTSVKATKTVAVTTCSDAVDKPCCTAAAKALQSSGNRPSARALAGVPVIGMLKLTPEKGAALFLALARQLPQYKFVAVTAMSQEELLQQLRELSAADEEEGKSQVKQQQQVENKSEDKQQQQQQQQQLQVEKKDQRQQQQQQEEKQKEQEEELQNEQEKGQQQQRKEEEEEEQQQQKEQEIFQQQQPQEENQKEQEEEQQQQQDSYQQQQPEQLFHSVPSNLTLIPPSADLDKLLQQMHLMVVPSILHEAFGMVVVDAMLRGVPVLVNSDSGALTEASRGLGGSSCGCSAGQRTTTGCSTGQRRTTCCSTGQGGTVGGSTGQGGTIGCSTGQAGALAESSSACGSGRGGEGSTGGHGGSKRGGSMISSSRNSKSSSGSRGSSSSSSSNGSDRCGGLLTSGGGSCLSCGRACTQSCVCHQSALESSTSREKGGVLFDGKTYQLNDAAGEAWQESLQPMLHVPMAEFRTFEAVGDTGVPAQGFVWQRSWEKRVYPGVDEATVGSWVEGIRGVFEQGEAVYSRLCEESFKRARDYVLGGQGEWRHFCQWLQLRKF